MHPIHIAQQNWLFKAFKRGKFSYCKVANYLLITPKTLRKRLYYPNMFTLDELYKISRLMGIDIYDLIRRISPPPVIPPQVWDVEGVNSVSGDRINQKGV